MGAGRTGYTAAIVTRLAAELGTARVRRLFAPSHRKKRLRDEERESLHALVALHLGRMKGPLMKIAQHAGYYVLDFGGVVELHTEAIRAHLEMAIAVTTQDMPFVSASRP